MIRKHGSTVSRIKPGDMAFGSLVDAGQIRKEIVSMLNKLELPDWTISFEKVLRCGQSGTKVNVITNETKTHRTASEITDLIKAELPERVTKRALDTFEIPQWPKDNYMTWIPQTCTFTKSERSTALLT